MQKKRSYGQGSIYFDESVGMWTAAITLPDGTRKRKRGKSQKLVTDWLSQQREAVRKGLPSENARLTVSSLLDTYLTDVAKPNLRPKTLDLYTYIIQSHIKPDLGRVKLVALKPTQIQSLYTKKLEAGLSKRTVQIIHSVLRVALNHAVKWGMIYRNPIEAVTSPTPNRKVPKTFSEAQVGQFLHSVRDHRWYPIYVLAIATGMRRGEVLGLHWEDIDLERGTINVQRSLVLVAGHIKVSETKTDAARRTIIVPDFALTVLRSLPRQASGLVFTTSNGTPISPRNLLRHYYTVLEGMGLPKMPFHNLRHTAATLLLKEGVNPKVISELLGHSSITLTLNTYAHIMPSIQAESAAKMSRLLEQSLEQSH